MPSLNPRKTVLVPAIFLWQLGGGDHDIDLTDGVDAAEATHAPAPLSETIFDPRVTGDVVIELNRSTYDAATGTHPDNPRQSLNEITAWIDTSNVCGFDAERTAALRTNDGTDRLKTHPGNMLSFNTRGIPHVDAPSPTFFVAGEVRVNEQAGLTAMYIRFAREHNRLAQGIAATNLSLSGNRI